MGRPFVPFQIRHGSASQTDDLPPVEPTYTLDRQVARARRQMGEKRWAELQKEWQ